MVVKTAEETRLATMKKLKRKEERVLQNGKTSECSLVINRVLADFQWFENLNLETARS